MTAPTTACPWGASGPDASPGPLMASSIFGTSMAANTGLECCRIASSPCLRTMASGASPMPWRRHRFGMIRGPKRPRFPLVPGAGIRWAMPSPLERDRLAPTRPVIRSARRITAMSSRWKPSVRLSVPSCRGTMSAPAIRWPCFAGASSIPARDP